MESTATLQRKHLVLLGAGQVHLQVLRHLARSRPSGLAITLVTAYTSQFQADLLSAWLAGDMPMADCAIDVEKLAAAAQVRLCLARTDGLDLARREVVLADGRRLGFDYTSLNPGPVLDRARIEQEMPGAREHALFVQPLPHFGQMWEQLQQRARERPIRVTVVGEGLTGIEMALAVNSTLAPLGCRVTLLASDLGAEGAARRRLLAALRRVGIEALVDRCTSMSLGELHLGSGARLACDVPLLCPMGHVPPWLAGSGLALTDHGRVAVDDCQRSTSHAEVWALGSLARRAGQADHSQEPDIPRSAEQMWDHLQRLSQGLSCRARKPATPRSWALLTSGAGRALFVWRGWTLQGQWLWRIKQSMDQRAASGWL